MPEQQIIIRMSGTNEDWKVLIHALDFARSNSPIFKEGEKRVIIDRFYDLVVQNLSYR